MLSQTDYTSLGQGTMSVTPPREADKTLVGWTSVNDSILVFYSSIRM